MNDIVTNENVRKMAREFKSIHHKRARERTEKNFRARAFVP